MEAEEAEEGAEGREGRDEDGMWVEGVVVGGVVEERGSGVEAEGANRGEAPLAVCSVVMMGDKRLTDKLNDIQFKIENVR